MKQEFKVKDNRVDVWLSGSMYVEEAADLREKLLAYIEKGLNTFWIDIHAVDYMDSSGLGVLVAIQKRALQKGGEVVLIGASGLVKEIIEMTRLNRVFTLR